MDKKERTIMIVRHAVGTHSPGFANNILYRTSDQIAWKGAFIWKKGRKYPVIIKLLIPKDAARTVHYDKTKEAYCKHRCQYAIVKGFYSYYTGNELKSISYAHSFADKSYIYKIDTVAKPFLDFSLTLYTCESGIHFYKSKTHGSGKVDSAHQNCVKTAAKHSW